MNKTNTARAIRAEKVLKQYMANLDGTESDQFTEASLAMLLCDIRHACDKNDVEWHRATALAKEHYYEEKLGRDCYLDEPGAVEEFPFTVLLKYPETYDQGDNCQTFAESVFAKDYAEAARRVQESLVNSVTDSDLEPDDFQVLAVMYGVVDFAL